MRTTLKLSAIAVFACATVLASRTAHAQAWVGYRNNLNLSLTYSYVTSNDVVADSNGTGELKNQPIINHSAVIGVEYDPLDRWAVNAQLALIADQWNGTMGAHGNWDDGSLHFASQDARIGTRYMALTAPFALTPDIAVSFPTSNYVDSGFAGGGRHIDMLHLGLSAGKLFYSGIPGLFLEGKYEFSLGTGVKTSDPKTAQVNQNRSDVNLVAGYYITPAFEVHLASDMRWTHGGVDFTKFGTGAYTAAEMKYHDRLLHESFILFGGGLSYYVTNSLQLGAMVRFFMTGYNTRDSNVFGLSLNYQVM